MENAGKALYIAGFALLFVFAASTAIYLYGILFSYMNNATTGTNLGYRAENSSTVNSFSSSKREVTVDEIYITLFKMEQMHVEKLDVDGISVTLLDVKDETSKFSNLMTHLYSNSNAYFSYSISGSTVKYSRI